MSEKIVLASTSPYRREQLSRLGLPFTALKPLADEEAEKKDLWSPLALAQRLAYIKAESLLDAAPTVIGGDQLVAFNGKIIGKSGGFEKSRKTLLEMRAQTHELITAVCIFHQRRPYSFVDITRLKMKSLTEQQIESYLKTETPYDCAGSYKIESKGLFLFEKIESSDFSAIQGLPLMKTARILESVGYKIL
ncbi:MAG: nucleoside triphosphate pyrophosphatase [Bdellovibrionota bacterium]